MPALPSAQIDLTRRYARELRRLQSEARSAFGKNETRLRGAALDLARGVVPGPKTAEHETDVDEIAPGVGHA